MDKRVFREFMRKDVVQKSIIFASVFGISITNWYGSNENDKFPYRIYFYHGRNLVGYIDATVMQLGDSLFPSSDFPFEFFTPIGIMKGKFDSYQEYFSYNIEEKNSHFDKIDGLFKIQTYQENDSKNYIIGSFTELKIQNKPLLSVSFNNCVGPKFAVKSYQHVYEEVEYVIGNTPKFVHYNYLNRNQKEKLAEITLFQDNELEILTAKYDFLTMDSYQNIIAGSDFYRPIWLTVREVDLKEVWKELENNDPRLLEFLNEVREEMIIYSNKSKPISLYDRLATLSFSNPKYQNSFHLTKAQRDNFGLENNPVLKRMREYKK